MLQSYERKYATYLTLNKNIQVSQCPDKIDYLSYALRTFDWFNSFYFFECIPYCHSFIVLYAFPIVILLVLWMHSLLSFF